MGIVVGGLEFYAGPVTLAAPDDLVAVICDFVGGARHTLQVAVQELDSRAIAAAILAASGRGVRVRIILEGDYLKEGHPQLDPWAATGAYEENRVIHSALLRAGVDVITDLNPANFHQKFVVRDAGMSSAAVLTGSTNFTLTDTGTNPPGGEQVGDNLNHVVILHGQSASGQYQAEFTRLREGTFGDLHERSPEYVTKLFPRLAKEAGLRPIRLHDLRHGAASLRLAAGVEIAAVSKMLGHSSIAITADTYSHLLRGVGRQAAGAAMSLVPRGNPQNTGVPTFFPQEPETLTEANRTAYLDEHPTLAAALAARGLPQSAVRSGLRSPYDTAKDWGAFVAFGC